MSDRLLQIALHAFPRRFRDARAEEIRGVFADAVAAGDRRVFGVAALADVVVAGWRERWRGHPPLGRYLWYRFSNRLPSRWHRWMLDDVAGWIGLRTGMWSVMLVMLVVVLYPGLWSTPISTMLLMGVMWVGVSAMVTKRTREYILQRNGYTPSRQWLPPTRAPQ